MESRGWWDTDAETELKARLKADVMKAFKRAESLKRCELKELFTDVYGGPEPWNIVRPRISKLLSSHSPYFYYDRESKGRNSLVS